jgi:hypothetical protein
MLHDWVEWVTQPLKMKAIFSIEMSVNTQQCSITTQKTGILHIQIITDSGISSFENVEIDFDAT